MGAIYKKNVAGYLYFVFPPVYYILKFVDLL